MGVFSDLFSTQVEPPNGWRSIAFCSSLEESISRGSNESLLRALWHTTDVLITGQYSEEQIWIFGQIIERPARELEVVGPTARRLAVAENTPINSINELAADKTIHVAEPVLRRSKRIDAQTLVSIASSDSEEHLLAMSRRESVTERVTDVLVCRLATRRSLTRWQNRWSAFFAFRVSEFDQAI